MRSRPSVPATTKWRPNHEIAWHHDRHPREIVNDSNSMRSPDCRTQLVVIKLVYQLCVDEGNGTP